MSLECCVHIADYLQLVMDTVASTERTHFGLCSPNDPSVCLLVSVISTDEKPSFSQLS